MTTLEVRATLERPDGFRLDVAFDVPPGITVLFGPSGSGKSTALAAIAGISRPSAGRIALGDDVWFDAEAGIDRPIERRKIAYVFQSLALFPHLSAVDNVAYGMLKDVPRAARRARAMELLAELGVGHLADRRPATFSGGEAQRVALSRALAIAPRIVLFDEPFSALDPPLRRALVTDVKRFVRALGVPTLLVTHHRGEARALGDRALRIEAGKIVASGPVDELVRQEAAGGDQSFADTPLHDGRGR